MGWRLRVTFELGKGSAAYTVMAYIVMAYIVMAYIGMAYNYHLVTLLYW